jgi:TP901 family phage tail tape measure protein
MAQDGGSVVATLMSDASQFLTGVGAASRGMTNLVSGMNTQMIALRSLSVAGFGFAGKQALMMAADFEFSSQKIVGLVGIAQETVDGWKNSMRSLGAETAKGPRELADALYYLTSAGIRDTTEAMDTLNAVSKASTAGLGDITAVSRTVVSAMNAWKGSGLSAGMATSVLVNTVKEGNMVATELAGSFGRVIPIASKMGVEMHEVGAAIAALTRYGLNSYESVTGIRQLLYTFSAPTKAATQELARFGLTGEYMREVIEEDGLLVAMRLLQEATGGNIDTLKRIVPNVRALTPLLALLGDNAEDTQAVFDSLAGTTLKDLDDAWKAQENSLKVVAGQFKATLDVAIIDFADAVGKILIPALRAMTTSLQAWNDLVKDAPQWVKALAASLSTLGVAIGLLKFAGLISVLGTVKAAFVSVGGAVVSAGASITGAGIVAGLGAMATALSTVAAAAVVFTAAYSGMTWLLKKTDSYDFWVNDELEAAPVSYSDLAKEILKTGGAYENMRRAAVKAHVQMGGQVKDLGFTAEATEENVVAVLKWLDANNDKINAMRKENRETKSAADGVKKLSAVQTRLNEIKKRQAEITDRVLDQYGDQLDSLRDSKTAMEEAKKRADELNDSFSEMEPPDSEPIIRAGNEIGYSFKASKEEAIDFFAEFGAGFAWMSAIAQKYSNKIPDAVQSVADDSKDELLDLIKELNEILEENLFANASLSIKDTLTAAMTGGDITAAIVGFFERAAEDSAASFAEVFTRFIEDGNLDWSDLQGSLESLTRNEDGSLSEGGISAIIGGGMGVFEAFQSGDSVSGLISGAMAGFAIGGPMGAAIGAIVGGLAGLFGGGDEERPSVFASWSRDEGANAWGEDVDGSVITGFQAGINNVIATSYESLMDTLMMFQDASLFSSVNLTDLEIPSIETGQYEDVIQEVLEYWLPGQIRNSFARGLTEGLMDRGYTRDFARRMMREAAELGGDASLEFLNTVIKGVTDLEQAVIDIDFANILEVAGRDGMETFVDIMRDSMSQISLYQERMMNELDLASMAQDASAIAEIISAAGETALNLIQEINQAQEAASESIADQIESLYTGGLTDIGRANYYADQIVDLFNSIETASIEDISGITGDIQGYINNLINSLGEDADAIQAVLNSTVDGDLGDVLSEMLPGWLHSLFSIFSYDESGATSLRDYLIAFLENLDQEQIDAFGEARDSIEDWADLLQSQADETSEILQSMGSTTDITSSKIQELGSASMMAASGLERLYDSIDSGDLIININADGSGLERELVGMVQLTVEDMYRG